MAGHVRQTVWVLALLCLIPAGDCCIPSVGRTVLSPLYWMTGSSSPESKRTGPVCSCSLLTEPCSLYVLHSAPEPYCPLYTRYCCDLGLLAAILPPSNVTGKWSNPPPAALAGSGKAIRALDYCGCTNYLLPCPVRLYETSQVASGWFQCPYYYRYCCGADVLRDVILPYVSSLDQEPHQGTENTQEQLKYQGILEEPRKEVETGGWWWWVPDWLTG